jgi:hypothetical protein
MASDFAASALYYQPSGQSPDQSEIIFSVDLIDSGLHGPATSATCHGAHPTQTSTELDPTGIADLRYLKSLKPITSAAKGWALRWLGRV